MLKSGRRKVTNLVDKNLLEEVCTYVLKGDEGNRRTAEDQKAAKRKVALNLVDEEGNWADISVTTAADLYSCRKLLGASQIKTTGKVSCSPLVSGGLPMRTPPKVYAIDDPIKVDGEAQDLGKAFPHLICISLQSILAYLCGKKEYATNVPGLTLREWHNTLCSMYASQGSGCILEVQHSLIMSTLARDGADNVDKLKSAVTDKRDKSNFSLTLSHSGQCKRCCRDMSDGPAEMEGGKRLQSGEDSPAPFETFVLVHGAVKDGRKQRLLLPVRMDMDRADKVTGSIKLPLANLERVVEDALKFQMKGGEGDKPEPALLSADNIELAFGFRPSHELCDDCCNDLFRSYTDQASREEEVEGGGGEKGDRQAKKGAKVRDGHTRPEWFICTQFFLRGASPPNKEGSGVTSVGPPLAETHIGRFCLQGRDVKRMFGKKRKSSQVVVPSYSPQSSPSAVPLASATAAGVRASSKYTQEDGKPPLCPPFACASGAPPMNSMPSFDPPSSPRDMKPSAVANAPTSTGPPHPSSLSRKRSLGDSVEAETRLLRKKSRKHRTFEKRRRPLSLRRAPPSRREEVDLLRSSTPSLYGDEKEEGGKVEREGKVSVAPTDGRMPSGGGLPPASMGFLFPPTLASPTTAPFDMQRSGALAASRMQRMASTPFPSPLMPGGEQGGGAGMGNNMEGGEEGKGMKDLFPSFMSSSPNPFSSFQQLSMFSSMLNLMQKMNSTGGGFGRSMAGMGGGGDSFNMLLDTMQQSAANPMQMGASRMQRSMSQPPPPPPPPPSQPPQQ
eukprot:CAMPEP_0113900542 /NCGR_PEP_ID=MMETSP0780_2-20120614/20736_1 /TAXON_ID=652834 /ORGANISM="Palpitomonas bilix" /LENGTH=784 /DNA_ID=CAMNT_0000893015 /DNA_START=162 /DNA_END=2519 /DNA_ORIENTATION=+ /assembly_acc=CAM_ASM_000599